jgi:integrase
MRQPQPGTAELARLEGRLSARGLSPATARIYLGWASRYLACAAGRETDPRPSIARFVRLLESQGCSTCSRRQALAALGFFLAEVRGLDPSPLLAPHRPECSRSHRQVAMPRPASYLAGIGPVVDLVRTLATATARPPIEILALRIGDLDLERGLICVRRHGNPRRRGIRVPFPAALRDALVDQIGESWRLHQLDFLASMDGSGGTGFRACSLPIETFRRHRLFPAEAAPARLHPRRGRAPLAEHLVHAEIRPTAATETGNKAAHDASMLQDHETAGLPA